MTRAPLPPNTRRYELIISVALFEEVESEADRNDRSVPREMAVLLREALSARARAAARQAARAKKRPR